MKYEKVSRRRLLTLMAQGTLATAALAAGSQVLRFLGYQPPSSAPTILPVGQPDGYAHGSLLYVAEARVYVGRDGGGLYAVDAVCPHLGCLVELAEEGGFICPCHDSRFDAAGRVLTGPATVALRYLHLWLDESQGVLLVDRTETVEPGARLVR